jgi:hypothetical protein
MSDAPHPDPEPLEEAPAEEHDDQEAGKDTEVEEVKEEDLEDTPDDDEGEE